MDLRLISLTPALRLLCILQFFSSLAYFFLYTFLLIILPNILHFSKIHVFILLWNTYLVGLALSCFMGYLQDFLIGIRKSLSFSIFLSILGYISLFLFLFNIDYIIFLYAGLAMVSIGSKFFTNGIYSLLGKMYPITFEDRQIEEFITLIYIINRIGALVGTLTGVIFSLLLGSISIYIPLLTAIFTYICLIGFKPFINGYGNNRDFQCLTQKNIYLGLLLVTISIIFAACSINNMSIMYITVWLCCMFCFFIFFREFRLSTRMERIYMIFAFIVLVELFIYYSLHHQAMNIIYIYSQSVIGQYSIAGFKLPIETFELISYFWSIIGGCILLYLHIKWKKRNLNTFRQAIFAFSCSLLSFLTLYISSLYISNDNHLSVWWIIGFYLLQSFSEIPIVYIGTSLFIKLLPKSLTSFALGAQLTIIMLPGLLFRIGQNSYVNEKISTLTMYDARLFFEHQFLHILILGLCFVFPLIIIQPIIGKLFYKSQSKKTV